jgi:nitrogen fixation-related uncharacterized protein
MLNLIAFIAVTLFAIAVILYYVFIVKPVQYEQDKAAHAKREAEERLEAIDRLLSDALSEASMGGRK